MAAGKLVGIVLVAVLALGGVVRMSKSSVKTLRVPKTLGAIHIDAELEGKKVWESDSGSTENLKDETGKGMVPFTQAKLRWSADKLYLLLYAGDLDLEGTVREADGPVANDDSFQLEFGYGDTVRRVSVSVLGTVADTLCTAKKCDASWQSHAEVAVDRDGTLNQLGDNDEEWVVEMALPFSSLGIVKPGRGTRIPFSVRRCEIKRGGVGACGGWGTKERAELLLDSESAS